MNDQTKHILNTDKKIMSKSLCGLHGPLVYKPTDSDCEECIERFKRMYPGSYEHWVNKEVKDKKND
jgi:hypothetical protein